MKKGINWLASYPKSGNTWVRVFLINLLHPELKTSINQLGYIRNAASRALFDEHSDLYSSELTTEEIYSIRPKVYASIAAKSQQDIFLKIHDVYDKALIPQNSTKAVIYLIRNPLDVTVSLSSFMNQSFDASIDIMQNENYQLSQPSSKQLKVELNQLLGSWSQHVQSWTTQKNLPVLVIKYEDIIAKPFKQFHQIVNFLELNFSEKEVRVAIEKSKFSNLASEEKQLGFNEKFTTHSKFFSRGTTNEGKAKLKDQQIKSISSYHKSQMEKFGYY